MNEIAEHYYASGRVETYLGDWHSHPNGGGRLSSLDRRTLAMIAGFDAARAPRPLMAVLHGGEPWRLAIWLGSRVSSSRKDRMLVEELHPEQYE